MKSTIPFIFGLTLLLFFTGSTSRMHMNILALGDSYTIGEGVSYENSWPGLLCQAMEKQGVKTHMKVVARTGWTTDELLAAIDKEQINEKFDAVFLLIGVNNQYRGRSAEEYRGEFRTLLERAIAFTNSKSCHVIVLSIPDWAYTPYAEDRDKKAISAEIDLFNKVNKEETLAAHAWYIDITGISRKAGTDRSLITTDGLHPSGKMYQEWVEKITTEIMTIKK